MEGLHLEKSLDQQKIFGSNRASDGPTPEFTIGPDCGVISHEKAGGQNPVSVMRNVALTNPRTSKKILVVIVLRGVHPRKVGRQRLHTAMQEAVRTHIRAAPTCSAVVTSLGLFSVTHFKRAWEYSGAAQKRRHPVSYWEGSRFWSGLVGGVDDPDGAEAANCG